MFNQPSMNGQPTPFPNKLKRPQTRPQFNPGLQQTRPMPSAPINGGSTADVVTDANGMVSAARPKPVPFSPASARTVEMNSPGIPGNPRFGKGNIVSKPRQMQRGLKGEPLM